MKERLNEVKAQAVQAREKLSHDIPEQRKYINKLDRIIRGTTYVRWMFVFSIAFSVLFLIASVLLFYPDTGIMLGFVGASIILGAICYFGVFIQIKLYHHTVSKTQRILDSHQQ
jgi:uncharacterized membrane protein YjjP (DUF1212 family)